MSFKFKMTRRRMLIGSIGMAAAGCSSAAYGTFMESRWLERNHVDVKLPEKRLAEPIRILHMSDLHASADVPYDFIDNAVDLGLSGNPDIACLTGDFVSNPRHDFSRFPATLQRLSKQVPTYASLGNHDGGKWAERRKGFSDSTAVQKMLSAGGIDCLHNRSRVITVKGQTIRLVGVGDIAAGDTEPAAAFRDDGQGHSMPVILLSHSPDSKEILEPYPWDLMLCGHSHGGQFRIPFLGYAPFAPVDDKRYVEGLNPWKERLIHTTKGVGSIYGIRINCRPEVSLLTVS